MSDRGDLPPDEGDAPPPSDEITEERLEGVSAPPPESTPDPQIDFTVTAELSGEETERLVEWAKTYELFADEETVEQESEVTQAAIATLPMPRDTRPPAIPLRIIAPPMPAPRMPAPSLPGVAPTVVEPRIHAAVTPIVTPRLGLAREAMRSSPGVAERSEPPRPPFPSGEFSRSRPRSPVPTVLIVAVVVALVGGGIYSLVEGPDVTAFISPAETASAPPPPPARVEPPAAPEAPPTDARVEAAKKALVDLGEGLRDCVKRSAMVLPGSSPAIPAKLEQTAGAGYEPQPNDFKTPMWSCANFHAQTKLRFQIQWQLSKGGSDGFGVAWLDDDGDGRADRAFAFKATLRSRGLVDVDPVESISATRPLIPVSY